MNIITITKGNINEHIKLGVTLVDFYAPWCGPCKIQLLIVEELAKEIGNQANIAKMNIEEELDLATEYNVQSLPTLLLLKDGYVVERMVWFQSKDYLERLIQHKKSIN
ncbi:thioredoxin [Bacillus cereus]|uniref:thioredoxin n=1 Tax=Bacillus cereus TaxID=1396 RepID=UPI0021137AA8|nr:thioredoxin [Bacillus cereus]